MEHWSVEDYKNFTNNRNRKSKYRANKVSVDGHTFDSQKEADYYCENYKQKKLMAFVYNQLLY